MTQTSHNLLALLASATVILVSAGASAQSVTTSSDINAGVDGPTIIRGTTSSNTSINSDSMGNSMRYDEDRSSKRVNIRGNNGMRVDNFANTDVNVDSRRSGINTGAHIGNTASVDRSVTRSNTRIRSNTGIVGGAGIGGPSVSIGR